MGFLSIPVNDQTDQYSAELANCLACDHFTVKTPPRSVVIWFWILTASVKRAIVPNLAGGRIRNDLR